MDPLPSTQCSKITVSQQDSHSSPDTLFFSSSSSSSGPAVRRRIAPADAPILICSPPDTPSSTVDLTHLDVVDDLSLGVELGLGFQNESPKGKSPALDLSVEDLQQGCTDLGVSKSGRKKSRAFKRKSKGSKTKSKPAQEEGLGIKNPQSGRSDEIENYRYQSSELLKDVIGNQKADSRIASAMRKLPTSIRNPQTEERKVGVCSAAAGGDRTPSASVANPVATSSKHTAFPANLLDVINGFSTKPNRRLEDIDILEIAAMKGIDFPPPRWWRPGGYDAKEIMVATTHTSPTRPGYPSQIKSPT